MYIDMLYLQNYINFVNNWTNSMRKISFTFVCLPGLKFLIGENESLSWSQRRSTLKHREDAFWPAASFGPQHRQYLC